MDKCILCGSERLQKKPTKMSDFVAVRTNNLPAPDVNLCFCEDCTFAFYDRRLTDQENTLLYKDYRGEKYQQIREQYECWYTSKVNEALNNDVLALHEQQRVIKEILVQNGIDEIKVALDYGGNEGKTFTSPIGTQERYVYDISGVNPVEGVKLISDEKDLRSHRYDFIMCNMLFEHLADPIEMLEKLKSIADDKTLCYIEVPSENPFTSRNKFSAIKNLQLLRSPLFNPFLLFRFWLKNRRGPFMPMKEHVNFYNIQSMRSFIESNGFSILDIQENTERAVLGNVVVLSVLFKKKCY